MVFAWDLGNYVAIASMTRTCIRHQSRSQQTEEFSWISYLNMKFIIFFFLWMQTQVWRTSANDFMLCCDALNIKNNRKKDEMKKKQENLSSNEI